MSATTEGATDLNVSEGSKDEQGVKKRTSIPTAKEIVQQAVTETVHEELEKKKDILTKYEEKGTLDARTVTDAVTGGGKASNPDAVDQLGLDILVGFRRKVFGLLILQVAVIWGLAAGISRIPFIKDHGFLESYKTANELYVDGAISAGVFVLAIIALGVLARYRYDWSKSLFALSIFTVIISTSLGIVCGPNIYLGVGLALGGTVLVAIPSCIRFKTVMVEVFPVAMFSAVLILIVGIVGWLMIAPEIQAIWVVPALILNCCGMVWLGFEMDWICSRLNPDEFLLPICLVWAELLTTLCIAILIAMAGDTLACETGGCCSGVYYYGHCDCWLYDNGDSSRKQYYRNLQKFQAQKEDSAAPAQQTMQGDAAKPADAADEPV